MTSPDLSGGLPKPWLESHERNDALQTRYGNFAFSVLRELENQFPGLPKDILTVGDNWFELVESHNTPNGDLQESAQTEGSQLFGDMWPIMDRENLDLLHILYAFREGVRAGSLDDRILESVAVLDRTSFSNPLFDPSQITHSNPQPWGQIVQLRDTKTKIFHITGGYTRKITEDLGDTNPGDDFSATIYLNEN